MQASNTRLSPEDGPNKPSSRAPSFSRPIAAINGISGDVSPPVNSPSPPTIVSDTLNFSKPRLPIATTNGTISTLFPPTNSAVNGVVPRSASGPPLRKAASSQAIGSGARLHNGSFKDLIARFNTYEESEARFNRFGSAGPHSNPSASAEVRLQPLTFVPSGVPLAKPTERREPFDREPLGNIQKAALEDRSLARLGFEISDLPSTIGAGYAQVEPGILEQHVSDAQKPRSHAFSDLNLNVSQWFQSGKTSPGQSPSKNQRRGSDGGGLSPNEHRHSRRRSDFVLSKPALFGALPQITTGSPRQSRLGHQRSTSDLGRFQPTDRSRRDYGPSSPSSGGSRSGGNFSAISGPMQSKIPVKSSPQKTSDGSPSSVKRSKTEIIDGTSPSRVPRRSLTPPGRFYATRYEASPTRPSNGGDRVKAIITAPVAKVSPPLRSSRPRQHVSSARSASPLAPRAPNQPGVSPKVSSSLLATSDLNSQTPEKENLLTQLSNAVYQRPTPTPKLTIDVKDIPGLTGDDPTTGATEFEEDDNLPTDDMPGSFPVDIEPVNNLKTSASLSEPTKQPDRPVTEGSDILPGMKEDGSSESADGSGIVLNKIMELRHRSSVLLSGVLGSLPSSPQHGQTSPIRGSGSPRGATSPRSGGVSPNNELMPTTTRRGSMTPNRKGMSPVPDSVDDHVDGGTIPIMLSDVQSMQKRSRNWQSRERLQRSRTQDSFTSSSKGLTPNRGSSTALSPPTGSSTKATTSRSTSRYTLDSDSYSIINRVLDQYHETGHVTEEMVNSFQQHILETDPELAARTDIDSLSIARVALEDMIRDHSQSSLFGSQSQSQPNFIRNHSDSDVFGIGLAAQNSQPSASKEIARPSPMVRKVTSDALQNIEPDAEIFGETVPPVNGVQNQQSTSFPAPFRSRHFSMADQVAPPVQPQAQPPSEVDKIPDDDIGPTPPPKDPKQLAPRTERSRTFERLPNNDRNPRQRQNSSSIPIKRPLLPEIPSTGGGLGLFSTPRASHESVPGQKSTNFAYPTTTPYNVGSSAQLGTPSPPLQPRQPSLRAASPASESLRTISRQTTAEHVPKMTPTSSATHTISSRSYEQHAQPVSVERPSSPATQEPAPTPEQRRLTKRRHLIKELVDTEFSFNQDMKVIEDIYKGTASAVEALTPDDRRILFGNSAQIVEFSESFLETLKLASASVYVMPRLNKWRIKRGSFTSTPNPEEQGSPGNFEGIDEERDRKTFLGAAFGQHMAKMEKIYGDYLRNHDLANQRLSRLQNIPQVHIWLNECHTYASDITSAWDLDSLLVKPVQRILKYPLLLKSLLEETHSDHPDHPALEVAVKQMMDVSFRINESKKRAELLDQVVNRPAKKKDYDVSNALSKAFGRRTDKLKQQVGLSDAVEDPEYKAISEKFGGQFFQLQVVMRDMEMYKKTTEDFIKQYNRYIEAIEEMIDVGHNNSPEMEAKWRRLALTIREMTAIAYMDHEAAVRKHCIDPMITLLKMHEGPQKLMQKRKKRIVEYAKYLTMKNRGERLDKKTQEQGEQFIALNETLKEELPKLFALTAKLVQACLRNYVDIQAQWHATWQRKIKAMLKDQRIPKDISEIVEAFHADFAYTEAQVLSLSVCNGSLLQDASFITSSASTMLGTDDSSSTKKRPSVITKTDSTISVPTVESLTQSPVLPHPDHVSKRRSNGSATFPMSATSYNSPRTSMEHHRLSYHSTSNLPLHGNGSTSPQRGPNRLRTVSSASARPPFSATPPIPPQRISSSTTVSYGPYNPTSTNQRTSSSTRPAPSPNLRNGPPPSNVRLSASSSKSAANSAAALARTSSSTLYSASTPAMSGGGAPPSSYQWSTQTSPNTSTGRFSGVFSSALPVSDSPPVTPGLATPTGATGGVTLAGRIVNVADSPSVPTMAEASYLTGGASTGGPSSTTVERDLERDRARERDITQPGQREPQPAQRERRTGGAGGREHRVLFLAASLFEFNIDRSRKEAGFPYLTYIPGEIFDVIAEKGELWLAKNQDDPGGLIGWIWEKHFAKLMPEGGV